jgi:uncharacterized protein (TIGR02391 family)
MTVPSFPDNQIEQVARILADSATHAELTDLFQRHGFTAPAHGEGAKWLRLREAFRLRQRQDSCGNNIAALIQTLMDPVRFTNDHERFEELRNNLNTVLAFSGLQLGEDGKLRRVSQANTLSEAQQRAHRLRNMLQSRNVHHDVLRHCRAELLQDNYFHAVLEATKSVAEKIRSKAALSLDGAELAQKAFGGSAPLLAINRLQTETELSEQRGFLNLLVGMFGLFRNVTAHAPKISWTITEEDALDLLSLVSYAHRRLDSAVRTHHPNP